MSFLRLESIDPQRRLLILTYKNTSISVDFSVVNQFKDFIGEVYEVYGTIEKKSGHDRSHCFALLVDTVQGADMKLIEESLVIFNKTVRPEYLNIFI